jgi:hypothetical protein
LRATVVEGFAPREREHSRQQFATLQTKGEKIKQAAAPKKEGE